MRGSPFNLWTLAMKSDELDRKKFLHFLIWSPIRSISHAVIWVTVARPSARPSEGVLVDFQD